MDADEVDRSSGTARTRRIWRRDGTGLEFDRLTFFTDAVFAIAITLVAVEIGVPDIADAGDSAELWARIQEDGRTVIAFFIAFGIIAQYWLANHRFVASLKGLTPGFAGLMMLYLAAVAFLPYPAATFGRYTDNGTAVALLAVSAAVVSLLEAVLFYYAYRADLINIPMSAPVVRWALTGSLTPVAVFLVSVPVAVYVDPLAGLAVWLASPLLGVVQNRMAPPEVGQVF